MRLPTTAPWCRGGQLLDLPEAVKLLSMSLEEEHGADSKLNKQAA